MRLHHDIVLFRAKKSTKVFYFSHYKAQLFLYDDMMFYDLCVRIMMKKIFCWRWFCKILLLTGSLTKTEEWAYFILPLTYCKLFASWTTSILFWEIANIYSVAAILYHASQQFDSNLLEKSVSILVTMYMYLCIYFLFQQQSIILHHFSCW